MNPMVVDVLTREIERLLVVYPELQEDETLRADMLEGETDIKAVLGRIVTRMKDAEAMTEAITSRIAKLQERRARYERQDEAMRALAFRVMEAANRQKLALPEATLSIRNGTPKVIVTDESALPEWAKRVRVEPDKAKIKAALQCNESVPGALLSNAEPTLAVRL